MDEVTRLRLALYRYGGHVPPCPGRPCECGFKAEWDAARLPADFSEVIRIAQLAEFTQELLTQSDADVKP